MVYHTMSALFLICVACVSCVSDVVSTPTDDTGQPSSSGDDVTFCNGAVDCQVAPPCWVAWCHQIQRDDPLYGTTDRWGTCRMDPIMDGEPCDGGAGRCDNRACVAR